MDRWVVLGCSQMYGTLHGMYNVAVVHGTENDAREAALQYAYETIDSYSSIGDSLWESAEADWEEDGYDCVEDYYDELAAEEVETSYAKVKADCSFKDSEIDDMIYNDYHEFVKEWCE